MYYFLDRSITEIVVFVSIAIVVVVTAAVFMGVGMRAAVSNKTRDNEVIK